MDAYSQMFELVDRLDDLLRERRGRQQWLFGKGERDRLHDIQLRMGKAIRNNDNQEFCDSVNRTFLRFLKNAGILDVEIREELSTLKAIRATLAQMGTLLNGGVFGKESADVAVELQTVVSWLRRLEDGMEIITKNMKP